MQLLYFASFITTLVLRAAAVPVPDDPGWDINIRPDEGTCQPSATTNKELIYEDHENPDPHQVYKFEQMSENLDCGAVKPGESSQPYCEGSAAQARGIAKSVSFAFGLGGEVEPVNAFISAGYEVTKSFETSETYSCQAFAGDTVCVFYRTAHTMYTVNEYSRDSCGDKDSNSGRVTTITAPNSMGKGGSYVCGRGAQCNNKGHTYWNNMEYANNGQTWAGGPVVWPFDVKYGGGLLPKPEGT